MKTITRMTLIVLVASILLTACSSPSAVPQATQATAVPAKVTPTTGYPAPNSPASQPTGYPAPDQNVQPTLEGYPAPGMGLKITAADGGAKLVDGTVLAALVKSMVTLDGNQMEVRKLADALKAVGIATYNKVSVNGTNGTLALTKEQVAQAYLDIAADGSIQLAVQGMTKDKWISGVQTLKID